MEIQKEERRVEAGPVRQDYSRDEEAPRPFPLEALGRGPDRGEQGFHPCADLCVKTWRGSSTRLPFPGFLRFSRNFYDPAWSLRSLRRLKSVAALVAWVPDAAAVGPSGEAMPLGAAALEELGKAFDLFDMDGDHGLSRE